MLLKSGNHTPDLIVAGRQNQGCILTFGTASKNMFCMNSVSSKRLFRPLIGCSSISIVLLLEILPEILLMRESGRLHG